MTLVHDAGRSYREEKKRVQTTYGQEQVEVREVLKIGSLVSV